MRYIIFQVYLAHNSKAKLFIEFLKIQPCATHYKSCTKQLPAILQRPAHQFLPNAHTTVSTAITTAADRHFGKGDSRRNKTGIGNECITIITTQVKAFFIHPIRILENALLLYYKHIVS